SHDEPQTHRVARSSLRPELELAAAVVAPAVEEVVPVKPATFQELEANIAMLKARAEERRELARKKKRAPAPAPPPPPPPPGFSPDIPPAMSELAFVQARTRDLLEEVAMIGLQ